MRNRDFRRQTEKRQKNRVKRYLKNEWECKDRLDDAKFVGKLSHVRGVCTCSHCANPRKLYGKKTRQEIIAEIDDE